MTPDELSKELGRAYASEPQGRKTAAIHLFGIRRAEAIRTCGASVTQIVAMANIPGSYVTEVHKGIALAPLVVERVDPVARRCSTCRFWRKTDDDYGQCRRNAPRPEGQGSMARWPSTQRNHWCGEYELQQF